MESNLAAEAFRDVPVLRLDVRESTKLVEAKVSGGNVCIHAQNFPLEKMVLNATLLAVDEVLATKNPHALLRLLIYPTFPATYERDQRVKCGQQSSLV